jgi:hypothetical protein
MASQAGTQPDEHVAAQLPPLLTGDRPWQRWVSGAISIALFGAIIWKLSDLGFARLWQSLPTNPIFWLAFFAYYFALPTSEWLIFWRLWRLPAAGFVALLRKLVSNEVLFGYTGELYFYTWARRHANMVSAPFGAIKDVSILSALAGNGMTLLMLIIAWPFVGSVVPQLHGEVVMLSAGFIIAMSMVIALFQRRIFSLSGADLRFIFGMHMARLVATTCLSGLMWYSALNDVPLVWLVLLATLQLLVTRLPFVPNKDLVFAGLAIFLIGHDSEVGSLIAMIAMIILAVHLTIGMLLVITELKSLRT